MNRNALSRLWLLTGAGLAAGCRAAPSLPPPSAADAPPAEARRAILLSIDSFSEDRMLRTLDSSAIPAIVRLFSQGACAQYARPAFPSVTAPGHAALWTGAYGDVSGIAGNWQPRLPRDRHTLVEGGSGFLAAALRAEPFWITAGAAGAIAVGHHVTQAPDAPGYPAVDGEPDAALAAARARAIATLASRNVHVVNGYNRRLAGDTAITERVAPPSPARPWAGAERLGSALPLLEIAWKAGDDSLFALLHGNSAYTHALVATRRDASGGVSVAAAPVRRDLPAAGDLARHFSEPLEIPVDQGAAAAFARFRLFALAPDASSFILFQPAIHVVEANRPDVAAAYARAVRGWVGNGAGYFLDAGGFGPTIPNGGDGSAEAMYLESLENVTLRSMEGSEWAWRTIGARVLLDYFSAGDELDHRYYGYLDASSPKHDPTLAARIQEVRQRGWRLVDLRLAHLRRLVGDDPGAALFVSGDHGMRATWRQFRPNLALMNVGLLAVDTAWRIDLSRTRALSPNGYWVTVNRTAWKGGIVPPAEEAAVIDAAERALRLARAPDGSPVVTRIWRAAQHDSLGLGGPVGGDLYYELAPGFRWTSSTTGFVTGDDEVSGNHGYPSTAVDMRTVLCATGRAFPSRRAPAARTIDAAPTVAEWLGLPAPPNARGVSVLQGLRGREE